MGGTYGHWGCPGGQKKFKHGHVAYQIDGNDEQNKMQVTFSSRGQTGDLGEVKRSNIINMSISKIFRPNFVCVLTNKR